MFPLSIFKERKEAGIFFHSTITQQNEEINAEKEIVHSVPKFSAENG